MRLSTVILAAATLAALAACSPPSTRIDGARVGATHDTTTQRPGVTRERTIRLTIPAIAAPEPDTGPGQGAIIPAGDADAPAALCAEVPVYDGEAPPAMGVLEPPGGTDSGVIAEAIRAARASGSPIELTITESETVPLTTDTTSSTLSDDGPSLKSTTDGGGADFSGRAGRWPMPWGGEGGGGRYGATVEWLNRSGVNVLHVIGGIVLVVAIVPLVLPPRRYALAATIAGCGVLIIAAGAVAAEYPWVLALALLAFLGVLGWLGYRAWRGGRSIDALKALAPVIERAPNAGELKDQIATQAGAGRDAVKAEVKRVKAAAKVVKGQG